VERRLGALAREQQRLVRLYRYGEIDDSYIESELQRLAKERESLTLERKGLEERLGEKPITPDDLQAVKEYCKQVAQNLGSLSFEEKRLALEVLQVKLTVEKDRLVLDGALPLSVASTHSGERARG
jgi:regulator of replication initiation timing